MCYNSRLCLIEVMLTDSFLWNAIEENNTIYLITPRYISVLWALYWDFDVRFIKYCAIIDMFVSHICFLNWKGWHRNNITYIHLNITAYYVQLRQLVLLWVWIVSPESLLSKLLSYLLFSNGYLAKPFPMYWMLPLHNLFSAYITSLKIKP